MAQFEIVHTIEEYYDGPRRGIANYNGKPHLYQSEWQDGEDLNADTFLLMELDAETVAWAIESWQHFLRWREAFCQRRTTPETHPVLSEDWRRHDELEQLLKGRMIIEPNRAIRKYAEFRTRHDPNWTGFGAGPLEFNWKDVP